MTQPIRYIALDFDNCICEINDAFRIVWDFLDTVLLNRELSEHWHTLSRLWIEELDKGISDGKLHFLNQDVMLLLKHVYFGSLDVQPEVFVYTNNTNEELIRFIGGVIRKQLHLPSEPWSQAFFPQDPRRAHEFSVALASDEPGKSFQGMKVCMGEPEDMTPESLMFLDDLLHPIHKVLGDHYIQIQPPFKCKDPFLPYLETLVKAIKRLECSIEHTIALRMELRKYLCTKSSHMEYFPAPRDAYREWNLQNWDFFLSLFQPFGYEIDELNDESTQTSSLTHYYKCRDLLIRMQGASSSESS